MIDTVVTDIRLGHGWNGWDVAEVARAERPDIRVVYTSGNAVSPRRDVPGSTFLEKPYTAEAHLSGVLRVGVRKAYGSLRARLFAS